MVIYKKKKKIINLTICLQAIIILAMLPLASAGSPLLAYAMSSLYLSLSYVPQLTKLAHPVQPNNGLDLG